MSGISIDMGEVVKLARDLGLAAQLMPLASEAALDEAGSQLQADAKSDAPVDTGALRDSIYLRKGKTFRRVGSPLRYGIFQEIGTSKMAPQPFLFRNAEVGGERLAKSVLAAGSEVL